MKEIDVLCMGELLIDFVASEPGQDVSEAAAFTKHPGGAPANVAVGLSRLGRRSAFTGKVGDDPFGHYLAVFLEENGVDVRGIVYDSRARTGLAFISLGQKGERSFSFYRNPSADMLLHEQELNLELLDGCRIFEHGSISLISEPSRSATYAAMTRAASSGALICFDPNLRQELWPDMAYARKAIFDAAGRSDIVKIDEEELIKITQAETPEAGISRLKRHTKPDCAIVLTMGERGCRLYYKELTVHEAGFVVDPVDTTGAGDGFVAGLLASILDNAGEQRLKDFMEGLAEAGWRKILKRANAVGAISTTKRGAIPSLPTTEELFVFMSQQGL